MSGEMFFLCKVNGSLEQHGVKTTRQNPELTRVNLSCVATPLFSCHWSTGSRHCRSQSRKWCWFTTRNNLFTAGVRRIEVQTFPGVSQWLPVPGAHGALPHPLLPPKCGSTRKYLSRHPQREVVGPVRCSYHPAVHTKPPCRYVCDVLLKTKLCCCLWQNVYIIYSDVTFPNMCLQSSKPAILECQETMYSVNGYRVLSSSFSFVNSTCWRLSIFPEPNNASPLNVRAAELWENQAEYKRLLLQRYDAEVRSKGLAD